MRERAVRSVVVAVALAALVAALSACRVQPVRDARVVENPSVVTLVGWNGTKGAGGTGFVAAPGRVVTCRHVAVAAPDLFVRSARGVQVPARGVLAESVEEDLVLLDVETPRDAPPLALAEREPAVGDALTLVGSPSLRAQTVSSLVVTETAGTGPRARIRCRGGLAPGASGSPVFDAEGRIVGVASATASVDPGTDVLVVPARAVRALAAGPLRPMREWGAATAADPVVLGERRWDRIGWAILEKDWKEALELAEASLRQPDGAPNLRGRVYDAIRRAYAGLGRAEEGVDRLRALATERPDDEAAERSFVMALVDVERWAELETFGRALLARHPDEPLAETTLGVGLGGQRRYDEALPHLRRVADLSPRDPDAHRNVGYDLAHLGRIPEAIAAYERAAALEPKNAHLLRDLALLRAKAGDLAGARRDAATVRRLDPTVADDLDRRLAEPSAAAPGGDR